MSLLASSSLISFDLYFRALYWYSSIAFTLARCWILHMHVNISYSDKNSVVSST